jgi:hypothetical protein
MNQTTVPTPTARCRVGLSHVDITPPSGIYHRFWGAAKHDQATGVHRSIRATVLVLSEDSDSEMGESVVVALDHCLFRPDDMDQFREETCRELGISTSQLTVTFSHTHSGGHVTRSRSGLPGGELIGPYLDGLPAKISEAYQVAKQSLSSIVMTSATGSCAMAHQRDFWDEKNSTFVCGFNPQDKTEYPVTVIRMTDETGTCVGTVVNYPCHPTTLAWDNTLISPDYIGAMRELVEESTGAPCLFLLAPCGDVGPRVGFVGDTEVSDSNGRQLGFAALSSLESMDPPGTDYVYDGPVISGATIGAWSPKDHSGSRKNKTAFFHQTRITIPVPYLPNLPTVSEIHQEFDSHVQQEAVCLERDDQQGARDQRALAERCRRSLERFGPLPEGETYPFIADVWKLGDMFWVFVEGEPYFDLQKQLNERFPDRTVMVVVLADGARCGYVPARDAFEKTTLYQVQISVLAAGCLEAITDAIGQKITTMLASA